jgi:hypothetical protein
MYWADARRNFCQTSHFPSGLPSVLEATRASVHSSECKTIHENPTNVPHGAH